MLNKIAEFLRDRIWRIPIDEMPFHIRALLRPLRVFILAFQGFNENEIRLRASALTFYTLLSVVPVLGVAFGIAKGFGLQAALERQIRDTLQAYPDAIERAMEFANNALAETRGGLVAGVGVIFLLWAVIRLLSNIEFSFNHVWGIKHGRTFGRRVFDFLSLILIGPILLASSGALTATLAGYATRLSTRFGVLVPGMDSLIAAFIPFVMVTILFATLYKFMPNTNVSARAAILSAFVAGVMYQVAQWVYFNFQVQLSSYNAVYGTFAALPLFLIWLQTSWLVILFGAEISFAVENEDTYALEHKHAVVSARYKLVLALRFTEMSVKRFIRREPPISAVILAQQLEVPVRLVREILDELVSAGVLSEVTDGNRGTEKYQPARTVESLTILSVIESLDMVGSEGDQELTDVDIQKISRQLTRFSRTIRAMPENERLSEL